MGPDPAVAAVRLAVRTVLREIDGPVLVACSGGADSLALAGALAFEAARSGHRAGGVTVDHGLQDGSAERAAEVVRVLGDLGLPTEAVRVTVGRQGGPEAAARTARYTALKEAAARHSAAQGGAAPHGVVQGSAVPDDAAQGDAAQDDAAPTGAAQGGAAQGDAVPDDAARGDAARGGAALSGVAQGGAAVLLGHTLDDQAETVLLGLGRGSGARSLAGMASRNGIYYRPLLALDRATVRRACLAMGLDPWDDPHNADPAYTRVRVRDLLDTLGPGVSEALARTARLLRDDADALDAWAEEAYDAAVRQGAGGRGAEEAYGTAVADGGMNCSASGELVALDVGVLAGLPRAVRSRVLRRAAIDAGAPAGALGAVHVAGMEALVTGWRGQAYIGLPGEIQVWRRCEKLLFGRAESS